MIEEKQKKQYFVPGIDEYDRWQLFVELQKYLQGDCVELLKRVSPKKAAKYKQLNDELSKLVDIVHDIAHTPFSSEAEEHNMVLDFKVALSEWVLRNDIRCFAEGVLSENKK